MPGALDLDDALAGGVAAGRALKAVKEQLRALPDNGLGYGLLRYLNPQTAGELARLAGAAARLQLSGPLRGARRHGGLCERARGHPLGGGDPALALAHAVEVNALTLDGAGGPELSVTWTWAPALISEDLVRDLAQGWFRALTALADHARAPDAGGRTPSDLPLLTLTQGEIDEIERQYPRIDDILPLAPLQEGLLFHANYDAQAPDVYTIQLALSLTGALDHEALARAARALFNAMPACAPASATRGSAGPYRSSCRTPCRAGPISISRCWTKPRAQSASTTSWRRTAPSASISPRRRSSALR